MHMIEPEKNHSSKETENKVNRVISQLITWKNPSLNASTHTDSA
jgi:hypothetical protein